MDHLLTSSCFFIPTTATADCEEVVKEVGEDIVPYHAGVAKSESARTKERERGKKSKRGPREKTEKMGQMRQTRENFDQKNPWGIVITVYSCLCLALLS